MLVAAHSLGCHAFAHWFAGASAFARTRIVGALLVAPPDLALLRKVVRAEGCAIIGQTAELAPADKRLYAIRDVTGTVETIPLLTSSILSKKLAAGLHGLAMDVKFGSGAFLTEYGQSRALAAALVSVANGAGLPKWPRYTPASDAIMDFAPDGMAMPGKDPWGAELDAAKVAGATPPLLPARQ